MRSDIIEQLVKELEVMTSFKDEIRPQAETTTQAAQNGGKGSSPYMHRPSMSLTK